MRDRTGQIGFNFTVRAKNVGECGAGLLLNAMVGRNIRPAPHIIKKLTFADVSSVMNREQTESEHGKMKNNNLIPFNQMPPEQHRELSKRGGIASGKKRKSNALLKKRMIELLRRYDMFEKLSDEEYADFKEWQRKQRKSRKNC